jgi:hypothetical protein
MPQAAKPVDRSREFLSFVQQQALEMRADDAPPVCCGYRNRIKRTQSSSPYRNSPSIGGRTRHQDSFLRHRSRTS